MHANFQKLYHPSLTILSAAVSVYYIFHMRPLCIDFDTHLISAGPKGGQKGHMPPRSDDKAYLVPQKKVNY